MFICRHDNQLVEQQIQIEDRRIQIEMDQSNIFVQQSDYGEAHKWKDTHKSKG
jgi:hypothetical protein